MIDPARLSAHRTLLKTPFGKPPDDTNPLKGLARELVLGVKRHVATLDAVLGAFTKAPVGTLEPEMREAGRLGVFQILFQPDVPAQLVVSSTAALGGKSAKRRGFLNAVLRRVVDAFAFEDDADAPTRDRRVVRASEGRVARFDRDVLPDPAEDLDRFLATQFSLRHDFVAELRRELPLEIDAALAACNRPLGPAFRTNLLRATPEAAEAALRAAGCEGLVREGAHVFAARAPSLDELPPLKEGLVTVQDATASEAAPFLDANPGEAILDLCAGVGGKTAQLAEIAARKGGPAKIAACDLRAVRLARLAENVKRLGVPGVEPKLLRLDGTDVPKGPFDRVLVDAPCSNSGVLMKRAEARHRLGREETAKLVALQGELLDRAASVLRPGGTLVYATCSILADENRRVIGAFLKRAGGAFELDEERLRYPHRTGRDGGYAARLKKST
jgi:16S rRNA (cytosine967-C5)-methyltransferase